MELKKKVYTENLFFCLAKKTPLFVIDERVYYCRGNGGENFFRGNKKIFGVREGPSLMALEALSNKRLGTEYEKYKKEFMSKELKNCRKIDEDGENSGEQSDLAKFVVKEIFPYLRKDSDKMLDKVLGTKKQIVKEPNKKNDNKHKQEIEKYIQKRTAELEIEPIRQKKPYRNSKLDTLLSNNGLSKSISADSLFLRPLDGFNFALYDKKVYMLSKAAAGGDLEIKNSRYNLVYFCDLEELAEKYSQVVMSSIYKKSLVEKLRDNPEFTVPKTEKIDTKNICSRTQYHENDFGFIRSNGSVTVYVDVPNYVLKDPHGSGLYKFSKHKLGIKIRFNDYPTKKPTLMEFPYALSNVAGPFYGGSRDLCMGNYTHGYFSRMPPGKAFAKLLLDARNVVLHGYTSRCHPRDWLDESYFSHRKISMAEVKRRKLPITNVSYSKRTKNSSRDDY